MSQKHTYTLRLFSIRARAPPEGGCIALIARLPHLCLVQQHRQALPVGLCQKLQASEGSSYHACSLCTVAGRPCNQRWRGCSCMQACACRICYICMPNNKATIALLVQHL